MKNFMNHFMALCALVVLSRTAIAQNNDYWISYPTSGEFILAGGQANTPKLLLFAGSAVTVTVEFGTTTRTVTVTPQGTIVDSLPQPSVADHGKGVDKGIHVYSPGGEEFKAIAYIGPEENFGATTCLPTNALGCSYSIISYPKLDSTHVEDDSVTYYPAFSVVATENATSVTITFPPGSSLPPYTVTLNKAQVLLMTGSVLDSLGVNDLTGTIVEANNSVAVFSGHSRAGIPASRIYPDVDGYTDLFYEEMLPVKMWGQLYHAVPTPKKPTSIYRIVAYQDGTDVFVDGAPVAILGRGKFYETAALGGGHEIYGSKPVLVGQFTLSGDNGWINGGPALCMMYPVGNYFSSTSFIPIPSNPTSGEPSPTHSIAVVVPSQYIKRVRLDNYSIANSAFTKIPLAKGSKEYSYAVVSGIDSTTHRVYYQSTQGMADSDSLSIMAYVASMDGNRDETATYTAGFRSPYVKLLAQNLHVTTLCDYEKTDSVSFTNVGTSPLIISSPSAGAPFTLLKPTTFPDTIRPGSSKPYVIKFSSPSAGVYSTTLSFATNEGNSCNAVNANSIMLTARKDTAAITCTVSAIDFGEVSCITIDTIFTITNTGTVADTITSATFSTTGMLVVSPPLPAVIDSGASKQFRIRIDASSIPSGSYSSTLHISSSPCNVGRDILVTATRRPLTYTVSPPSVDFDVTAVGKVSQRKIEVRNDNTLNVRVSGAHFEPLTYPGTVTTIFPIRISANGKDSVAFSVAPPDSQSYVGRLCVTIDSPCTDEVCIPVRVEGAEVCVKMDIAGLSSAHPGETVMIPVVVEPSKKFSSTKNIDVTVKYDRELLQLAGDPNQTIGGITVLAKKDGEIRFTVSPTSMPPPTTIIARLPMTVLLSSHAEGTIEVTTSLFTLSSNEEIAGKNCPSSFTVDSACIMPHDLRQKRAANIEGIYPNPSYAKTVVELHATNNPVIRLEVYDLFGRQIEKLYDGTMADGNHEITINTQSYATGMYFCRLVHGDRITTKAFTVGR